ncbi:MAG: MmgE/PrpD family protein [Betaproteobacteria bacterium]|nr:MmgE/PrpD family protein [Betaproteobacteria bacterium]
MGLTRMLASWTAGLRYQDLPGAATAWVKAAATDYLAVALAACPAQGPRILKRHVLSQYASGGASLIGDTRTASPEAAALVNGNLAHWEEYDDATFGMSGHPSVVILPALFAAAETHGGSGRDFASAYVAGFEVCARVGRLINPQAIKLGWVATPVLGTLGAAAAVAKLRGFDAAATENALGLAAMQSSGMRTHMGSMAKPLSAGLAARGGLAAAEFAGAGLAGADGLLEDRHGFVNVFSGGKPGNAELISDSIGKPLEIVGCGIAFKRFPCNFHAQAGVVAVLRMAKEEGVTAGQVESVRCLGNHMVWHSLWNDNPRNGLEGKLSLHYCIAAALLDGQLEVEQFTDERAGDPRLRALMKRVSFEPHPAMAKLDFTQGQDFLGMEVVLGLKGGKTLSRRVTSGFSVPGLDGNEVHAELIDKFTRNARRVLPPDRIDDCLARIRRLENLDSMRDFLAPVRFKEKT